MNILLTSAGRRSYMAEYFKNALKSEGITGQVIASNSRMSPALISADDFFITPPIYDSEYIPFLTDKCRKLKVDLIVPLFDIDLPVLAKNRARFEAMDVKLAVSDPGTLEVCNDKYRMSQELGKNGIRTPETFLTAGFQGGSFPCIVKPRFGMGSIGLFKAYDERELIPCMDMCARRVRETYLRYESGAEDVKDFPVIIQRALEGQEYGLDVVADPDGNYMATFVRRKISMRAGETDEAVTCGRDDPVYDKLCSLGKRLAEVLKPKGIIDVDVICTKEDENPPIENTDAFCGRRAGKNPPGDDIHYKKDTAGNSEIPYVIDINARFGGGYPFSHIAGADVPRAYILFYEGRIREASGFLMPTPGVHGYKEIILKTLD